MGTTKSSRGLRPVSHADFFMPAQSRQAVHNGRVDRPNTIPSGNKVSRREAVVETRPPQTTGRLLNFTEAVCLLNLLLRP